MQHEMSKRHRRIAIITNYLSVTAIVLVIEVGKPAGLNVGLIAAGALTAIAIGLFSFAMVYWRTRLWHLVHARFENLDERQVQSIYAALRHSYYIFAIACLVIIYFNIIVEGGNISALVAAGLIYLSHVLPASIVGWTEKEVLIPSR